MAAPGDCNMDDCYEKGLYQDTRTDNMYCWFHRKVGEPKMFTVCDYQDCDEEATHGQTEHFRTHCDEHFGIDRERFIREGRRKDPAICSRTACSNPARRVHLGISNLCEDHLEQYIAQAQEQEAAEEQSAEESVAEESAPEESVEESAPEESAPEESVEEEAPRRRQTRKRRRGAD